MMPEPITWTVWAVGGRKVVHKSTCRHAGVAYNWANDYPTADALAKALVENRSINWHRACQVCSGDLDDAITRELVAIRPATIVRVPVRRIGQGGGEDGDKSG